MFDEFVIAGFKETLTQILVIKKQLKKLPEGYLTVNSCRGHLSYYWTYLVDGKRKRQYIRVAQVEMYQQIDAKKRYYKEQLQFLEEDLAKYERALKIAKIDPGNIRQQTEQLRIAKEQREQRYMKELSIVQGKRYKENYRFPTLRGELVASKAEMMIADALAKAEIPYKYEEELVLEGHVLHPDFTILYHGRVIYWEHCGMMDKDEYVQTWRRKQELYTRNHITEGINLLITYEDGQRTLTQNQIESIIQTRFSE